MCRKDCSCTGRVQLGTGKLEIALTLALPTKEKAKMSNKRCWHRCPAVEDAGKHAFKSVRQDN